MKIYYSQPLFDDSVIRGKYLESFFDKSEKLRKVYTFNISLNENIINELKTIKKQAMDRKIVNNGIGIYYYALIVEKDTFYCSSGFKSWVYDDYITSIQSTYIKEVIHPITNNLSKPI